MDGLLLVVTRHTSASPAYRSSGLDVWIDVVPAAAHTMCVAFAALCAACVRAQIT